MNEQNNLFDFEVNEEKTEDLLKKAKGKSVTRIVATSLGVAVGVIILVLILKIQITPLMLDKEIIDNHMYRELYGANTYIGQWTENYDILYSSAVAPKYKIVDGIVVPMGEVKIPSKANELTSKVVNEAGEVYGVNGERIMLFYHPSLNYTSYRNDMERLGEIKEDKVVEMAISFDKGYTFDEVINMLPKEVTLQWSWLDSYNEEMLLQGFEGVEVEPWYEDEVAGIKSFNAWGEKIENPVEGFLEDLEIALRRGEKYREIFKSIEENLKGTGEMIRPEAIKILGVVVAGTPEELSALRNSNFVKATSFGAIVERY